jgi:hypothetical protein
MVAGGWAVLNERVDSQYYDNQSPSPPYQGILRSPSVWPKEELYYIFYMYLL